MRKLTAALIIAAGLATAKPAYALPIALVDTGEGPPPCDAFSCSGIDWRLSSDTQPLVGDFQWLAGRFFVPAGNWTITAVKGWIYPEVAGEVRFQLYSDDAGGFVPGSPIVNHVLPIDAGPQTWYGPSGLNWDIGEGSYWLAFEVPDAGSFYGVMTSPSAMPLVREAFAFGGPYVPWDDVDIGVRVEAERKVSGTAVPDTTPTALLFLLGSGLIGAALRRDRRPTV